MDKYLKMIEKTLITHGYCFIAGHKKSNREYLYLFWSSKSNITFGCYVNALGMQTTTVDFGSLEYSTFNGELCLSCYAGCMQEDLSEHMILECISQVKKSVRQDMDDDVLDEEMRNISCLGNHTTDIETYFQKYDYTISC